MTIALSAGPANTPDVQSPTISSFRLANGLDVVVIPDRRAPVVTHMVWYKVGSADEPAGKSGIAHFLEHLMFKGTEKNPGGFSKQIAELGGQENAFTSYDYTAYFQRVAKEHLGSMMAFEADRMTGLALSDEVVNPERDVVLEERKMRIDNDPASQLAEEIASALFTHHPYGTPIIGWENEIEGLTRQDAIDFHARFYTPNNATLVVAGDINADEVRQLAEVHYGPVARRADPPARIRPQEPKQRTDRRVTLADKRVEQPIYQRHWRAPSYITAQNGEAEALDLLAQMLGGGQTARIYQTLVAERKLASAAGAFYGGSALDESRFGVWAIPMPGVSFDAVEAAMDEEIARIANEGIQPEELERAKTRLIADAIYAQDNQSTLARYYGATLSVGGKIEDLQLWPQHIAATQAARIQDVTKDVLLDKKSVVGLLEGA